MTTSSSADAILATAHGMVTGFFAKLPLLATGLAVFLVFWAVATGMRGAVE